MLWSLEPSGAWTVGLLYHLGMFVIIIRSRIAEFLVGCWTTCFKLWWETRLLQSNRWNRQEEPDHDQDVCYPDDLHYEVLRCSNKRKFRHFHQLPDLWGRDWKHWLVKGCQRYHYVATTLWKRLSQLDSLLVMLLIRLALEEGKVHSISKDLVTLLFDQ